MLELLVVALFWGALWVSAGYVLAAKKGRGCAGAIWGAVFGPIGVVIAYGLADVTRYPCPTCAEPVRLAAKQCAHCSASLTPRAGPAAQPLVSPIGGAVIGALVVVALVCCLGLQVPPA